MKRICLLLLFLILPVMLSAQSIVVNWNANTETDLAGYKVYYGTASGVYGSPIDVGKVTTYTIANVLETTTYYIALTAYDTSGNESVKSVEASATTLDVTAPAVPGTPTVTPGTKSLLVSWAAVTSTDLAGYKIYYGTASGVYRAPVDVGKVTSYTISGLANNTTYYIRISSYDTSGNESAKNVTEVSSKTKDTMAPAAPGKPTITITK